MKNMYTRSQSYGPGRGAGRGAMANQGNKPFQPGTPSFNQQSPFKAGQQPPNVNQQQPNTIQPSKVIALQPPAQVDPESLKSKPILKQNTPPKNQPQKAPQMTAASPAPLFPAAPGTPSALLAKSVPSVAPTTPAAPKPTVAPTTPVAPKPTVAPTTPVVPKPTVAPTTPVVPKPTVAPTTPVVPKPTVAQTTPAVPKPTVAPKTPVAPKPTAALKLTAALKPTAASTPTAAPAPTAVSTPTAAPAFAAAPIPTGAPVQNVTAEADTQDSEMAMEAMETTDQPRWKRNKVPGTKANRKLKRLRMDHRLRKTLMPKNAIMVLNEMKAGVQFVFPETPSVPNSLFLVHAQLDGKTYVGQGLSKILARQNAAENAFKCLVLEKMAAAAKASEEDAEQPQSNLVPQTPQSESEEMKLADKNQAENNGSENDINMMDVLNSEDSDNIPWRALANFALYKLLNEWQNQGTVVLMPRPGVGPVKKSKPEPKPVVAKELPPNAELVHPVMLLNQMRPGTTYAEVCRVGNPPNTLFTLGVHVDGNDYTGTAKNKKEAKKAAAMNALASIYGLEYPEETKTEAMDISQTLPLEGFVAQQDPSI